MMSSYILIKTELGMESDALTKVRKIKGVKSAHTVTGPYDMIVYVEEENLDKLGKTVISKIQNLKMIRDTMTCIVLEPI